MKSGYKQTEIGIIPEDWEVKTLGEISEINMGQSPDGKYYNTDISGLPLIQGNADIENRKQIIRFWTSQLTKTCEKGDILMTVRAPVGEVGIAIQKSCIGRGVCSIRANNVFASFLYYLLQFKEPDWKLLEQGSTFTSANSTQIRCFTLPFPPSELEQSAIAEALSDIDSLITEQKKLIAKKKAVKQGAMQELLRPKEGWVEKRLGEIAEINMGQSPDSKYYNTDQYGLPLIQGNADIEYRKQVIRFWTSQLTKICEKDDILMTVRAPVGEVGIAIQKSCIGRGVCSIKAKTIFFPFLYYLLIFKEPDWKLLEQGSTFTSANSAQIRDFVLKFPPLESEQKKIAQILSDMDTEIEHLEKRLSKYRMIKQGMMNDLLTGKVRLI